MSDYSTLSYGDRSARVNILQCRLDELGFLNIDELTEYFGPATKAGCFSFSKTAWVKANRRCRYRNTDADVRCVCTKVFLNRGHFR